MIDGFNREGLCIDVDFSLPAVRAIRSLEQIIEWRGKPKAIRCDNDPEYISSLLAIWAESHNISLLFIQLFKMTKRMFNLARTQRLEQSKAYEVGFKQEAYKGR